jgi:hypothetical protein
MDAKLAAELAEMAADDQRVRTPPPDQHGRPCYRLSSEESMEWRRVDVRNTDRLREIIEANGWPGYSLVGEQGAEHAWLIAQHSDNQLDFQREVLGLLTRAVAHGEASPKHVAFLTDRVRTNEGREQLYGTQMSGSLAGQTVPWPVEDPGRLDERRAAVGLEPFAEYAARFRHSDSE